MSQTTSPEPSEIFDLSTTFEQLGLRSSVLKGVKDAGFEHPTDIQAKIIPVILQGKDVIAQAKTGTGKTAAFGLPILHHGDREVPMQALVLVPTRELAAQVSAEINDLAKHTPIHATSIVGGESMRQQVRSVRAGAHILVGTPGRIMDLQDRGEIRFDRVKFVVLDEVDRMLDIGFRDDIRRILKTITHEHQTIFCSATISDEIERLGRTFMKNDAVKIVAVSGSLTVSLVDQKHLPVEPWDKRALLLHLLKHEEPDTTVVFCKTKATVHKVTQYLRDHGIDCREIHGDLAQEKRNRVMKSFRGGSLDVLVASDLAARGLDIEHISHVINYDLPEDPEIYVHRIGRTARAGRRGVAWAFVTPEQGQLLTEIEKLEYPEFKPGPVPQDVRESREKVLNRPKPMETLAARAVPEGFEGLTPEEIARRFPGGIIPKGPPPKRGLGAHFKSRR